MNLVSYYRENGFQVKHIPVRNDRHPALSDPELEQVWKAYQRLEAGPDPLECRDRRTAASHVKRKLKVGLKKGSAFKFRNG